MNQSINQPMIAETKPSLCQTSRMKQQNSRSRFWSRIFIISALIVTTAVSSTIVVLSIRQIYTTGSLVQWVVSSRATVQIIVHLLSVTLAAFQIYALTSFISFGTNLQILSTPVPLDTLKLRQALNAHQLDFNLPLRLSLVTLMWALMIQIPGALWAGAVSPVLALADVSGTFNVPAYPLASRDRWGQACYPATGCSAPGNSTEQGSVSDIPWKFLSGLFLNSLRDASSRNSSTAQHKKIDSPQFTFYGRSYGVASAVGLIGPPSMASSDGRQYLPEVTHYSFSESGYVPAVKCTYNESSDLRFEALQLVQGQGTAPDSPFTGSVTVFQAVGSLPTGVWNGFTTISIVDNETAVALASVSNDTAYFCGFLGGSYYPYLNPYLNQVQCDVTFNPTLFNVDVDLLTQNISVAPVVKNHYDIDDTGGLIDNAFKGISFISQILTTMYTGLLGDALLININAVRDREGHTNATKDDVITGLAESLERLLDDYLGAIGASQLLLYNQSHTIDSRVQIRVIQLGQPIYAYLTWAINLAIIALSGFEAWRTKIWKSLPYFDCLDTKSVILGMTANDKRPSTEIGLWNGDAGDRKLGKLKVMLNRNKTGLSLIDSSTYELPSVMHEDIERPSKNTGEIQELMRDNEHDSKNILQTRNI